MKEYEYLDELISRYPVLAPVKADIRTAYETLKECYERGGKLLIAGNGGSCADSEHIVGELMKGFVKKRPVSEEIEKALKTVDPQMGAELSEKLQQGLPAIALTGLLLRSGERDVAIAWAERARTTPESPIDPWALYWAGDRRFLASWLVELRRARPPA